MEGKTLNQFVDDLYNNGEMEFIFEGKKYIVSAWLNKNASYTISLPSIEEKPAEVFSYTSRDRREVVEKLLSAKVFNEKNLYTAEDNIVVTYG